MMFILALLLLGMTTALAQQKADLIVRNARIYPMDAQNARVSGGLAAGGGKILAVGDVSAFAGPSTRVIDAHGATIVPGFIDSHAHMHGLGQSLETIDLRDAATVEEAVRRVAAAVRAAPQGEWIRGRAWDQTRFPGGQFPNADQLSAVSPDHPVYLVRVDGHAAWVNRKALAVAGVTAATPDPAGGRIHRDAKGAPTGILIDTAQGLVSRKMPGPTPDQIRARLARAAQECARLGLTTVHDAGVGEEELDAYRALIREGRLPVRIYAMIRGAALWKKCLASGPEIGDFLTVRGIKLMSDGALGSRGAAMKEPYSDEPGNRGLLILSREEVEKVAREAAARGFQVNTHAIGDRANRTVLEAYGAALGGANDRRFRIEHAQIVSLDDIPLFEKYSVLASIQSTHATSDMRWAEQRVGPERIHGAYAWRRFLSLGVPVANGSDFPVEDANPLWGFHAAVTRQDRQGNPPGGWFPEQRMTRQEALHSWTLGGAYAAFEERRKGSLEPGKLADFVVLSRDIMECPPPEILNARVTLTVLGGNVVYRAR